jgi:hypothetical protein
VQLLRSVFRKKKNNETMLTQFVNSVVIIDDKPEEVNELVHVLNEQDIQVSSFTPNDLKSITFKKNRNLFFLDLSLDDSKKTVENIATIRSLLKKTLDKDYGNYGVVMWTKHSEHIDALKEKIQEDKKQNTYPTPLFIVGLDKLKYKTAGSFDTLFTDVEDTLKKDAAATFFLEWSNSVQQAQNATVSNIYSLLPDYKYISTDFPFILKKLALHYTGIEESKIGSYPLYIDAFKSFDDILHAELINCQKTGTNPFTGTSVFSNPTDVPKIYAHLNTAILIDENNIDQNTIIPGNVYEIKDANNKFKSENSPQNAKNIVIEITPPCDFSNSGKRIRARLIGGFLMDADVSNTQKQIQDLKCKKECFYAEVFPIMLQGCANPQLLILDFRYFGDEDDSNLQDALKYKILFRTKPKLFADVLQKFSAHAARLGLSVIH